MAFTVTANLTDFFTAETTTGVTANSGALDPDYFVQGSNSITWNATKNGVRTANVNLATAVSWSTYTYAHLYVWMSSSVAAKMENKSTGSTTRSGVNVRATLANGAYREWHVAGADTWAGEWKCFCIDMSHTGTQLFASSGTFSSASNLDQVDITYDLSNSGNIRNAVNCWFDVIRVGEGLTAYNTTTGDDQFDFAGIAAQDEATANRYGILETKDGVIFCQGLLRIGDSGGTNHNDFYSADEVLVFKENDGTGSGLVHDSLYGISVESNSTGADQYFTMGIASGGVGRNGTVMQAGGPNVKWFMDLDASGHMGQSKVAGSFIQGATGGVYFTNQPGTGHNFTSCTFQECGQVDPNGGKVTRCFFIDTNAGSTEGALLYTETDWDSDSSLLTFINNTNAAAIEIPSHTDATPPGLDWLGWDFASNTTDVRYTSTNDNDVAVDAAITITNTSSGTLTDVVNPVTFKVTVVDADTGSPIQGARVLSFTGVTSGVIWAGDAVTVTRSGTVLTVDGGAVAHNLEVGQKFLIRNATEDIFNKVHTVASVVDAFEVTVTVADSGATSTTGSPIANGVFHDGTTDVNGEISDTRTLSASQSIQVIRARKGSSVPRYKTASFPPSLFSSTDGLDVTLSMVPDE